ncbi:hypothetical protein RJ639_042453 [Escallonia herrerae]|uniref:DUF6598 domain-containing protein n=1 Tax=Escallonia herrerae TaxID=1293975 RepID=A0AA88WHH5_9ASTE|nr:hypothetical protein RJ639_042453 [Escallonia herrerae]
MTGNVGEGRSGVSEMSETYEVRFVIVETEREAEEQDELEIEEHANEVGGSGGVVVVLVAVVARWLALGFGVAMEASMAFGGSGGGFGLVEETFFSTMSAPSVTGYEMMEIFKLRITSIIPTRHCLFGTLIVRYYTVPPQIIYSPKKVNNAEPLRVGAEVLLTGPPQCISALGPVSIQFVDHPNIEPGPQATFLWDGHGMTDHFDRPLYRTFYCKYGSVMMSYAVFTSGVGASVEVTLKSIMGKDSTHIYGSITAENNRTGSDCAITLFSIKNSRQSVKLGLQQPIPLSRSEAVVPEYGHLIIRADLCCRDIYPGAEIAKGHAYFYPTSYNTYEESISGKYGMIQVKVTWHM